jgi:exopolysaccharide biosynthesis predicted pyruvyltransferase EpsI
VTKTNLSAADAAILASQAHDVLSCLDEHIPQDRPVAILLFPFDDNVGNHMMWLAITDYLERRGIRTAYVAHEWGFDIGDLVNAIGNGTILFIGGVTISRLWPEHADVKRQVAEACPHNRLISLPSTMLFLDDDDRRQASTIFGDHRDVVIMARDPVSEASAREVFASHVSIVTVHDSTFILPLQPRVKSAARHDIIWLAREDHESAGFTPPENIKVFDWPVVHRKALVSLVARIGSKLGRSVPMLHALTNPIVDAAFRAISRRVISNGNRVLDEGKVLVTDRLHPHVLCILRDQPCVLLPDRFGKNRAVWDYSSSRYSNVFWADGPGQALEIAQSIASEGA